MCGIESLSQLPNSLSLWHESSHREYINNWEWQYSYTTFLMDAKMWLSYNLHLSQNIIHSFLNIKIILSSWRVLEQQTGCGSWTIVCQPYYTLFRVVQTPASVKSPGSLRNAELSGLTQDLLKKSVQWPTHLGWIIFAMKFMKHYPR